MKNLENGKIIEHSYNTGSKIDVIQVRRGSKRMTWGTTS